MTPQRGRRRIAGALLAVALLPAAAASPVTLDPQGLAPPERAAAEALLAAGLDRLPADLRRRLPPLRLTFTDALPDAVHGRFRGRTLLLDRALLAGADGAPGTPALAALLHELGHALDRRLGLSRDPRLLDLAGWQVRPRRFGLRNARNPMRDRSPDPYELHDPAEFVAVNLEHFLLDPEYACRRPALHRHFADRLGTPGAAMPDAACAPALPFVAPSGGEPLEALDPARVQAVEYLFAEPTSAPMSRWGHSMLRLVVCAPGRAPGPDCRFDLEHHRVLSFRAFVDDVQISSWRGLTGRYPSRLFVLPLSQVVDEYTRVELRGLRSVPLRLSGAEIAALLRRAAQLHWNYDGRYTFLGNNCASETFKLLHDGVPRLAGEGLAAITPNGLLRKLERKGVADPAPLSDPGEAERLGYRFPAADAHYDALFAVARDALALPAADARAWLALAPDLRRPWLEAGDLRATAALLVLEGAALRRTELRARDALKRRLLRGDPSLDTGRALLDGILAAEGVLVRPAALLAGVPGYGLPQADERAYAAAQARRLVDERRGHDARLRRHAEAALPDGIRTALEATRANLDLLGAHLRALAAADRGIAGTPPDDALPTAHGATGRDAADDRGPPGAPGSIPAHADRRPVSPPGRNPMP